MWLLTALIAGLAVSGLALAGKPPKPGGGGGGDPGPLPPGTIYFQQADDGDGLWGMRMKADGSGKVGTINGEPSYQSHEGSRWFLTSMATEGMNADGTQHAELFAVDEDGNILQLTDDPDVEPVEFVSRWAKNDSFLSYVAIVDASEGRSAGLFVAEVDWSLGVPAVGTPVKVLEVKLYDDYYPEVWFFDWSPAGDEVVYMRDDQRGNYSLDVKRFFADGTSETRSLGYGRYPEWSPDGSRIAFQNSDSAIWTMRPDGTGGVKLSSPKVNSFQSHVQPTWSPDSQHLAFTQITRKTVKGSLSALSDYDILRISASGDKATNLTADTDITSGVIGWR
jgi:hypothetical protein